MPTDVTPGGRAEMVFGMDQPAGQERDSLVVFGGSGTGNKVQSDAWYFDLNYNKWSPLKIQGGDGPVGGLTGAGGGIDAINKLPEQTLWVAQGMGTGNRAGRGVYALKITGKLFEGAGTVAGSWSQMSVDNELPAVSGVASLVGRGPHIVTVGGVPVVDGAAWPSREGRVMQVDVAQSKVSAFETKDCIAGRVNGALAMIPGQDRYALLFGGFTKEIGSGVDGQIDVLNVDTVSALSLESLFVTTGLNEMVGRLGVCSASAAQGRIRIPKSQTRSYAVGHRRRLGRQRHTEAHLHVWRSGPRRNYTQRRLGAARLLKCKQCVLARECNWLTRQARQVRRCPHHTAPRRRKAWCVVCRLGAWAADAVRILLPVARDYQSPPDFRAASSLGRRRFVVDFAQSLGSRVSCDLWVGGGGVVCGGGNCRLRQQ
jgi:hypothetical protein